MKKKALPLIGAGLLVPVLYYGSVLIGGAFYPGYNHVTQYASELGSSSAVYPQIFNVGIITMGVAGILAALGFYYGLNDLTGKKVLPVIILVLMALFGFSMIMGGLFPMPDMRHHSYGLALGVNLIPSLIAVLLWKDTSYRLLAVFLIINTVAMVAMFIVMLGIGQLLTQANVGLVQRCYSLTVFPWIGIVAYVLLRSQQTKQEWA